MKKFVSLSLDIGKVQKELKEFKKLLDENPELDENRQILPFFKSKVHLSTFIGQIDNKLIVPDLYAFEHPLFGDFRSDLVIGDSTKKNYLFIEFENATEKSIFQKNGMKATKEWSPRFEHGYSQIVDWFRILNDMRSTDRFEENFGGEVRIYNGLLVIGRSSFLDKFERKRFDWRVDHVKVNSKDILCMTYDELYEILNEKLQAMSFFKPI